MDIVNSILRNVPMFRHMSDIEISYLRKTGRVSTIKKGQTFDMKGLNSFNIVVNGIFEIEALGKTDIVYLSPGSFFGDIPFSENRHSGTIKARVDSTLILFSAEDLYRFFFTCYRGLRGYLRTVSRMGFKMSENGQTFLDNSSRIITVYSPDAISGKSLLSALLGLSLKKHGRTIILDVSYSGNSIFNYFEKKITPPVSHKTVDGSAAEKIILDRIEHVDENLDVLNISFNSKVRVNPDILPPILFILSKEYKYILLDLSDHDSKLRDMALGLSDRIFTMGKRARDLSANYPVFDTQLREGQRVYYVVNEFYAGAVKNLSGGLVLEKLHSGDGEALRAGDLPGLAERGAGSSMVDMITRRASALVMETNLIDSIFFTGFFSALSQSGRNYELMYGSSFSYIVMLLYLLSGTVDEFRKRAGTFFSEDRIRHFLDITFPERYIYKNQGISRFAGEVSSDMRIEIFNTVPVALLSETDTGGRRLFSTGYGRDILAASFLMPPVFDAGTVNGARCDSGFPHLKARVEDLFRTDMDEITYVSVNNSEEIRFRNEPALGFYGKYVDHLMRPPGQYSGIDLADRNIVLDVSEKDVRPDRIMEVTEDIAKKLL